MIRLRAVPLAATPWAAVASCVNTDTTPPSDAAQASSDERCRAVDEAVKPSERGRLFRQRLSLVLCPRWRPFLSTNKAEPEASTLSNEVVGALLGAGTPWRVISLADLTMARGP